MLHRKQFIYDMELIVTGNKFCLLYLDLQDKKIEELEEQIKVLKKGKGNIVAHVSMLLLFLFNKRQVPGFARLEGCVAEGQPPGHSRVCMSMWREQLSRPHHNAGHVLSSKAPVRPEPARIAHWKGVRR